MSHIYSCSEERKQCMNRKKEYPEGHRVESRIIFLLKVYIFTFFGELPT